MDASIQAQEMQPGRRWQRHLIGIILGLVILLALIIAIRIANEPREIPGVVVYNHQSRGHDDSFVARYSDLPPVGGIHHSQHSNCGVYLSPVNPDMAIHSLEHGAVWITYYPELSGSEIKYLRNTVRDIEYLIISPFPGQKSPLVLTAWGLQLELNSVDDPRMIDFISRYRLGPIIPERGASCVGGFGHPIP